MVLLFQNWGSYESPAEFNVLSLMDLLTVTLLFGSWVFCGVSVLVLLLGIFLFHFGFN